jgi:ribosomal protein L21E
MNVIRFPGRIHRTPPRVLGIYEGSVCKLLGVRNGCIQIETIHDGAVKPMWVSAEHVRMFEEVESVMSGHDPRPCDGAA